MLKKSKYKKIVTSFIAGTLFLGGISYAAPNDKENYKETIQRTSTELFLPQSNSLETKLNTEENKKFIEKFYGKKVGDLRQEIYNKAEEFSKKGYNEKRGKKTSFVCARFVTHLLSDLLKENNLDAPNYLSGKYDGVKNLTEYLKKRRDFDKIENYSQLQKGDIVILDNPKRKGAYNHVAVFSDYGDNENSLKVYGEPGKSSKVRLQYYLLSKKGWKFTEAYRYAKPKEMNVGDNDSSKLILASLKK